MRRARVLVTAALFAAVFAASATAAAQPVSGATCEGPTCPLSTLTDDLGAAADAAACAVPEQDPELLRRWNAGASLSPSEFIAFIAPLAQRSERETGVPASVTIAQAIVETGWGKSARRAANNLFGIKGEGTRGSVRLWTREYVRGRWVRVRARFAAYEDIGDSVVSHGRLISESPVYADAMRETGDPERFAQALQRAGYATDPGYARKLMSIIRGRNLTAYDGTRNCT